MVQSINVLWSVEKDRVITCNWSCLCAWGYVPLVDSLELGLSPIALCTQPVVENYFVLYQILFLSLPKREKGFSDQVELVMVLELGLGVGSVNRMQIRGPLVDSLRVGFRSSVERCDVLSSRFHLWWPRMKNMVRIWYNRWKFSK